MTKNHLHLIGLAISLGILGRAEANMLGVTQRYPDVSLNNAYLIYDNNGINGTTGLLKVVSFGSTLYEGAAAGGSSLSQSYLGGTDSTPDVMLTIAVRRNNGNWVNTTANGANKVTIGFGNSVVPNGAGNTPGFSWSGDITGFGWQENIGGGAPYEFGTAFDASWNMTNDVYEDMPSGLSQFVNGILTSTLAGYGGGIKITNSAGFGGVSYPTAFMRDWVFGTGATTAGVQNMLSPYLSGLANKSCANDSSSNCLTYVNSTLFADVFVPIPPALWLWAGALTTLLPSVRKIKIR